MVSDAVPSNPPSAKQSTAASRMRSLVSSLLVLRGRPGFRLADADADADAAPKTDADAEAAAVPPSATERRRRGAAPVGGVLADRLVDGVDRGVDEAVVGADDPVVGRLGG